MRHEVPKSPFARHSIFKDMQDMNIYLIKMTAGWNDKYSYKNTNQIALDSNRKA